MGALCCVIGVWVYLQSGVIYNFERLIHWDDKKWLPSLYEARQKDNKQHFCIGMSVYTLCVFFFDVVWCCTAGRYALNHGGITLVTLLPYIFIPLILSYIKAQFLHALWITWNIERYKKRNKN